MAFYADANFPRDSRKLLRTINAEYPNAVYHKTMSGLLTAGKGVSFDEVMKLVETATEQKPLFQKESTVDGDLDLLQKIINAKHNKKPYNISEKRFWALFSRTGKTNNPKIEKLYVELNQMFVKAKMSNPQAHLHGWVRGDV